MKKLSSAFLLIVLSASFCSQAWAQATTEGSDFWVTFLQADQDNNHNLQLELTITSRYDCKVIIENIYTTYSETVQVKANISTMVRLYDGDVRATQARNNMNTTGKVCYAVNSEQADNCALHVTAKDSTDKPVNISLFASTYKQATFDATNVIPTASLRDDYIVQTYTPSDHGGVSSTQGSHFAIIAAEDNVVVDYWPTVATTGHAANTMVTTPTLQKGQVWYVWTGKKDSVAGDLSGTKVKARDNKKIAVFQGCPHTNIPYQVKQRDHIFSQAMPTTYWGSNFVLTASKDRKKDIIRVLALYDNTDVYINDEKVHTFNFNTTDPKQYWEFIIGENGWYAEDGSCYLTTSCPCAVHLFIASQNFDGVSNGDPAMLWVNPIEQRIDQITFATYNSANGTTNHYTNIVTDKPKLIKLDGNSIENEFKMVNGNSKYYYAQVSLGNDATSHTLKSDGGYFIAHVYGFTDNESYGYSAGSATVGREIQINNVSFRSEDDNNQIKNAPTFCINEPLNFVPLNSDGSIYQVLWDFGDGTSTSKSKETDEDIELLKISHVYTSPGWYDAKAILYGEEHCTHPAFTDTILTTFRVVRPVYEFVPERVCKEEDYTGSMKNDTIWPDETVECSDTIQIPVQIYKKKTSATINQEGRDSALVNGKMYYSSETIKWTTENINGCDSFVTCNLTIITCLDMDIENDSTNQVACWGEPLNIQYTKLKGEIDYKGEIGDKVQFVYTLNGEKKTVDVDLSEGTKNVSGTITLPTEKLAPGVHHGKIQAKDYYCSDLTMEFPFDITISYPDNIMKPKFGNTIALYQKGKGGNKGWDLDKSTFVWYHDGDSVATGPVYYTPKDANGVSEKLNGEYYVAITTNGKTILSCPKTFKDGVEVTKGSSPVAPAAAPEDDNTPDPAKKVLQNRQIFIVRDGQTFNIYGQKVQ